MKKKTNVFIYVLTMGILLPLLFSCSKDDSFNTPVLTTFEVTGITLTNALSGGNITDDGGATVTSRGVCWSEKQTPTIKDSKTMDGAGAGSFKSNINELKHSKTYYVRAYATNSKGTGYGSTMLLNTKLGVEDVDGNVYNIVTIGTQTWMAENLRTTKYNGGISIPEITDNTIWSSLTRPAYCWYNNEAKYKDTYGALYNWYTKQTGKLCPEGWRIPSGDDWETLRKATEGGMIKESGNTHWNSSKSGATNKYGFTALPGGYRSGSGGTFHGFGYEANWWTDKKAIYNVQVGNNVLSGLFLPNNLEQHGHSVRCIKD